MCSTHRWHCSSARRPTDPGRGRPAARPAAAAPRARTTPDGALARHPRRADHGGAGLRRLPRRAQARPPRAATARPRIAVGRSPAPWALRQPRPCRGGARWRRWDCAEVVPRSWRATGTPLPALARLGAAVGRVALTVRHWQRRTGWATGAEPSAGAEGSSACRTREHPLGDLCGLAAAALLRRAALEDVALWHERDIPSSVGRDRARRHGPPTSWSVGPPAVDDLVVNAARMRGTWSHRSSASRAVLLALVRKG